MVSGNKNMMCSDFELRLIKIQIKFLYFFQIKIWKIANTHFEARTEKI